MFTNLFKIIMISFYCLKSTYVLKKIDTNDFSKLNITKFNFTEDCLKFLKLKIKINLTNNKNMLSPKDNYMFIINHRSLLDILIVENTFHYLKKKNINNFWIAKEELKKMFIFGNFFKEVKSLIFIKRNNRNSTKKMIKEVKSIISKGNSNICIFPEGTRNKSSNTLLPFKKGSELLAKMNNLKIINVYIKENTNHLLKDKRENREVNIYIDIPHVDYNNLEQNYISFKNLYS